MLRRPIIPPYYIKDFIWHRGFTHPKLSCLFSALLKRFKLAQLANTQSIMFCISQFMPTSYCLIYILRAGVWVKITDNNWICMGEAIDQAEGLFLSGYIMVLIFCILCFSKCNTYIIAGNITQKNYVEISTYFLWKSLTEKRISRLALSGLR